MGLRLGSAGHKALSLYYNGVDPTEAIAAAEVQLAPNGREEVKSWELLYLVLSRYIEYSEKVDKNWNILGVEQEIQVTVANVTFFGYTDLIVYDSELGQRMLVDHKFNQQVSTNHLPVDPQISFYQMMMAALREPVDGLMYNIIRMTKGGKAEEEPVVRQFEPRGVPYLKQVARESVQTTKDIGRLHSGKLEPYRSPQSSCGWDCQFFRKCINDYQVGQ